MRRMKKGILVVGLLTTLMLLTAGCAGQEKEEYDAESVFLSHEGFYGEITEYHFDDNGAMKSISLHIEEEYEEEPYWFECDMEVLLTDRTQITCDVPGFNPERFLAGDYGNISIQGTGQKSKEDGGFVCEADTILLYSVLTDEAATVSDGTQLKVWKGDRGKTYTLQDGTEILDVTDTYLPDFTAYPGHGLDPAVQKKIYAYYEAQGDLFDLQEELENAYKNRKKDSWINVTQAVDTVSESEKYIYYRTYLHTPWWPDRPQTRELWEAFDKSTGEKVDTLSLFTLPPEEVFPTLIRMAGVKDEKLVGELRDAFRPEYIWLRHDHLGLVYPEKTLPSHPKEYGIWFEYDENIKGILKPEAVPPPLP